MSLTSLSAFPSLKTHHSIQPTLPTTTTPSKFGAILVYRDASVAATEAVSLANAAVDAATEAVSLANASVDAATGIGKVWPFVESENGVVREKSIGVDDMRRKRRRKRRNILGCVEEEENFQNNFLRQKMVDGSVTSKFLSSTEEAELCFWLKEGARIEVSNQRMKEREGNIDISRRVVLVNARESKERLVRAYRGLVAWIARWYQGKGLRIEDLIQEGTIGLLRGAEKFDPSRGCKLSTCVYWWIRQAIVIALAKNSRLIRLPFLRRFNNDVLSRRLRGQLTYEEIAEALDVDGSTVKLVFKFFESSIHAVSLDRAIMVDQHSLKLKEIIPGPDELTPEKMVERELVKEEVAKLLSTLNKREEELVRLYYGLNREPRLSFAEIGKLWKLSRERIRQIHGNALSKLQQNTLVDTLKFYVV